MRGRDFLLIAGLGERHLLHRRQVADDSDPTGARGLPCAAVLTTGVRTVDDLIPVCCRGADHYCERRLGDALEPCGYCAEIVKDIRHDLAGHQLQAAELESVVVRRQQMQYLSRNMLLCIKPTYAFVHQTRFRKTA